jgi:PAS domain S-box-containing protein
VEKIATFWDIPGMQSKNSLEFLAKLLDPICIYDEQGQTVYASPTFLEMLQSSAEEVSFFQYFPSESISISALINGWQRALQGETVLLLLNSKTHVEIECLLQFNQHARLMFLSAKKSKLGAYVQQLTNEYEQLFLTLFNHPNLATILVTFDGRIARCNAKLHELLGTQPGEILHIETFVHPEDKLIDLNLRQRLLNGEIKTYTIEKRLISRSGEVIWINASVSLITLSSDVNHAQRYFVALLEDITENKKIYTALIRTEEKWKTFVLNSLSLFIQTSSTGQIIYASPAVERTVGYQGEALLGIQVTDLIHPEDIAIFEDALQAWSSGTCAQRTGIECRWKTRSATWAYLYTQGQRFPLALGMDGIVITGYDITVRKQAEAELRRSDAVNRIMVHLLPDLMQPLNQLGCLHDRAIARNLQFP